MKLALLIFAFFAVFIPTHDVEANSVSITRKKADLYEGFPFTMEYDGMKVTLTCIADAGCFIRGIEVNLRKDKNSTLFALDRNAEKTNFSERDLKFNTFFMLNLGSTGFELYQCEGERNSDGDIGEFDWSKCNVDEDVRYISFMKGDKASFKKIGMFEVDINEGEAVFRID